MTEKQWEQTEPSDDGVAEILDRYAREEGTRVTSPRQELVAPLDGEDASAGEGIDAETRILERAMTALRSEMDAKLATMRQDLQGHAERTAQSFTDKATARLTQRQKEQMDMVERTLAPLREQLGPDYDATLRQAKLDVVLSGNAQDAGAAAPLQPQAPVGGGSADGFAGVYLSAKLGDQRAWSADDQAAIQSDLSQARDWQEWMAVVDRYAQRRSPNQLRSQGPQSVAPIPQGNISRAQPVGTTSGARPTPSLAQLNSAYNRAVAEGDLDAMTKIGAQIDATLNKR